MSENIAYRRGAAVHTRRGSVRWPTFQDAQAHLDALLHNLPPLARTNPPAPAEEVTC